MDFFTHALVGAVLAQAFFARRLGRLAPLLGALAAILPDIDRVLLLLTNDAPGQTLAARAMLDQATHAVILMPVLAMLAAVPFFWLKTLRYRRKFVLMATLVAVASHGLLDLCASQGTALFWPLWNQRLAMDWISWFDPLLALLLTAGVIAGVIRRNPLVGRATAGLLLLYLGMGAAQHQRALAVQSHLAQSRQHEIQRARVIPAGGNLIVWRSLYQANRRIHIDAIRIAPGSSPAYRHGLDVRPVNLTRLPADLKGSLQQEQASQFVDLAQGWAGFVPDRPGFASPVHDLRFAYLPQGGISPWAIKIDSTADADENITWVHTPPPRKNLWRDHLSDALTGQSNGQAFVSLPPIPRD